MAAERNMNAYQVVVAISSDASAAAAVHLSKILWRWIAFSSHVRDEAINEAEQLKEEQYCVICLGQVSKGEKRRILPECNHGFHEDCIAAWLHSSHSSNCPLCRRPVRWSVHQQRLLHALVVPGFINFVDHVCSWFLNPLAFD